MTSHDCDATRQESGNALRELRDTGDHPADPDIGSRLTPIVSFILDEVQQSSEILRQLSEVVSSEIAALARADDLVDVMGSVHRLSEALQREDRVQQRLDDVCATLRLLDRSLASYQGSNGDELHATIASRLRLEEMRAAFAVKLGHPPSAGLERASDNVPRAGDVDLF